MTEMVQNNLQLTCKNQSAALERLLRVVRFRGFSVVNFNAQLASDGCELSVALTVSGDRPIHLLESQLHKNYEVTNVQVIHANELTAGKLEDRGALA